MVAKNIMTPLADAAVGREVLRMVEEWGFDARTIFNAATFDNLKRTKPGDEIASVTLTELFDRGAHHLGRPDFGIAFAEWATIRNLGFVALLWDNYSTLDEVFAAATKYMSLENSAMEFHLERDGDEARAIYTIRPLTPKLNQGSEQFMEAVLAIGVKLVRELFMPSWRPIGVEMAHPLLSSRRRMYDFFRSPVANNGSEYALTFPSTDLRVCRREGDVSLRSLIERFLDSKILEQPADLSSEVKRTISWLLRFGSATLEETSALFAIGPRTLQRKLRIENTDFATLLTEVRIHITLNHLSKNGNKSIGDLTTMLGYSEPSAVSRFIKQHFGHNGRALSKSQTDPTPSNASV